jgi:DNA-binding MarR family transcriptional regulator
MLTIMPRTSSPSTKTAERLARTDEIDRLRLVVLRLSRRIRNSYDGGVTPSQLTVLSTLDRNGPLTVGQIAELEHVRPPSASKIVAALESAQLVARTTDPDDRRCQPIALTPAGTAYVEQSRAAGRTFIASRIATADPSDADAIRAALPALERLLIGLE